MSSAEEAEAGQCDLVSLMVQLRYRLSLVDLTLCLALRPTIFETKISKLTTATLTTLMTARIKRAAGDGGAADGDALKAELFGEALLQDLLVHFLSRALGAMELALREATGSKDAERRRLLMLKCQLTQIRKDRDRIMQELVAMGARRAEYAGEKTRLLSTLDQLECLPLAGESADPDKSEIQELPILKTPPRRSYRGLNPTLDPLQLTSVERRRKVDSVMARLQRIRQQRSMSSRSEDRCETGKSGENTIVTPEKRGYSGDNCGHELFAASPTPIRRVTEERRQEVVRLSELIERITCEANQIRADAALICDKKTAEVEELKKELDLKRIEIEHLTEEFTNAGESHRREVEKLQNELNAKENEASRLHSAVTAVTRQYDEELVILRKNALSRNETTRQLEAELIGVKEECRRKVSILEADLERNKCLLDCAQSRVAEVLLMQEEDVLSCKVQKDASIELLKSKLHELHSKVKCVVDSRDTMQAAYEAELNRQSQRLVNMEAELTQKNASSIQADAIAALQKEHSIQLAKQRLEASEKLHKEIGQCRQHASAQRQAFVEFKAAAKEEHRTQLEKFKSRFYAKTLELQHSRICLSVQLHAREKALAAVQTKLRKSEQDVLNLASTLELELQGKEAYIFETTKMAEELEAKLHVAYKQKAECDRELLSRNQELQRVKHAAHSLEEEKKYMKPLLESQQLREAKKRAKLCAQLCAEKMSQQLLRAKAQKLALASIMRKREALFQQSKGAMSHLVSHSQVSQMTCKLRRLEKSVGEHTKEAMRKAHTKEALLQIAQHSYQLLERKSCLKQWILKHLLTVSRRDKAQLDSQLKLSRDSQSQAHLRNAMLQWKLKELDDERTMTLNELQKLSIRYEAIEEKLRLRERRIHDCEEELSQLQFEKRRLANALQHRTAEASRLQLDASKTQDEFQRLTSQLAGVEEELERSMATRRELSRMLQDYENRIMASEDWSSYPNYLHLTLAELGKLDKGSQCGKALAAGYECTVEHGKEQPGLSTCNENVPLQQVQLSTREPFTEISLFDNKANIQQPSTFANTSKPRQQRTLHIASESLEAPPCGSDDTQNAIVLALHKEQMVFVKAMQKLAKLRSRS